MHDPSPAARYRDVPARGRRPPSSHGPGGRASGRSQAASPRPHARRPIRARHYSPRTEKTYVHWIRRYIFFHGKRHPAEMGAARSPRFSPRSPPGARSRRPPRTRRSALCSSSTVRCSSISLGSRLVRAKRPERLPVVLTREEVRAVLARLNGVAPDGAPPVRGRAAAARVRRLRVKDVDFGANQIMVRDGKGGKDRGRCYPPRQERARRHLTRVREQHTRSPHGAGWVELPAALARKYPMPAGSGAGSGYSRPRALPWTGDRAASPSPPARVGPAARGQGRGARRGPAQARDLPHLPA